MSNIPAPQPGNVQTNQTVNPPSLTISQNGVVANPGNSGGTDPTEEYKGLQRSYQQLFDADAAKKAEIDTLNTKMLQLTQELDAAKAKMTADAEELTKREQKISEGEAASNKITAERDRIRYVVEHYPELLPLEKQGLFDNIPSDQLEAKLKAISESVLFQADAKVVNTLTGLTGGATLGGGTQNPINNMSEEEMLRNLDSLAGSKDPEKVRQYEAQYKAYLALISAKQQ